MALYRVEVIGEAREVYDVEADSEQEAMDHWFDGKLWVSENSSMEPVNARPQEED